MKKMMYVVALVMIFLAGVFTSSRTKEKEEPAVEAVTELAVPERVIVMDFGHLDTLRALGLGDRIIGTVTENVPSYIEDFVQGFENVGTLKEPDMEKIASLKPDLIIISNRLADFAGELEQFAPVLLLGTDYADQWASTKANIQVLGETFDVEQAAEIAVLELEEDIAIFRDKNLLEEKETLAILLNNGSMSAFSNGSRFDILFKTFGYTPVAEAIEVSTHGQSIGYEGLLEINPGILFVVDRTKAIENTDSKNDILDNQFVEGTQAAKDGQIFYLDSELWYLSGGGLESTRLMLEELQETK